MTYMKHLLLTIGLMALLTACHDSEENITPEPEPGRAVLVYMAANNNLGDGGYAKSDLMEMMEGSKTMTGNDKLYVLYSYRTTPGIFQIENGDTIRLYTFDGNIKTSDPATLRTALKWMVSKTQDVDEYGLVLWGHSTGWEVKQQNTSSRRRSYDAERTDGTYYYMNITDMAEALSDLPRLRFIFADCCVFQCVESCYELRNVADYIIGSPAEIPASGAPYNTVVPTLFGHSETFYKDIIDRYFEQQTDYYQLPLSAVKTAEMEQLAQQTHTVMASFVEPGAYQQTTDLIYYFDRSMIDMNDFIRSHAPEEEYLSWKKQFDQTVVYKKFAATWMTDGYSPHVNFNDFTATEEKYGGISMFVYQQPNTTFLRSLNETINQMGWYKAAGLSDFGW